MFRRGFTLIELMIVVVVVGILAAIAIPMYNNATVRAKQAQAKVVLAGIRESLEEWYEEYGGFPEWWDGWPLGFRWHDRYFWFHPIAFRGNRWVFLDYYHPEEDPVYEYTLFISKSSAVIIAYSPSSRYITLSVYLITAVASEAIKFSPSPAPIRSGLP